MQWITVFFCFLALLIFVYLGILLFNNFVNYEELTLKAFFGGKQRKDNVKDLFKHPRTKSEARVIKVLEDLTGEKFPTVNPGWLVYKGKQLELDGYNNKLKLALEFSGPLHRKWFPNIETYEQYIDRVEKDKFKLTQCAAYGVHLIVIDAELPQRHYRNYLLSRLYDYKIIQDIPLTYIEEQTFVPWIREF